jgi:hypothetical protein
MNESEDQVKEHKKQVVASGLELLISKLSNFSGEAKNNFQDSFYNFLQLLVTHYVTFDVW